MQKDKVLELSADRLFRIEQKIDSLFEKITAIERVEERTLQLSKRLESHEELDMRIHEAVKNLELKQERRAAFFWAFDKIFWIIITALVTHFIFAG
jgi:hypothetical protein